MLIERVRQDRENERKLKIQNQKRKRKGGRTFFKKNVKTNKKRPQGAMGGLQICLGVNISFFCEYKPTVKFQNSN